MEESEVEGSGDLPVGRTVVPEGQGNVDNETTSVSSLSNSADTFGGQNESSSNAATPQEDKTELPAVINCPKCKLELNPHKHKFCSGCGKDIQEHLSSMLKHGDKTEVPKVIYCPKCSNKLDPRKDNFCSKCGNNVQKIVSSMLKHEENSSGVASSPSTSSEPHPSKVAETAGNVKDAKKQIEDCVGGVDDKARENLEKVPSTVADVEKSGKTEVHGPEENLETIAERRNTSEPESSIGTTTAAVEGRVTPSHGASTNAVLGVGENTKASGQERQENRKTTGGSSEPEITLETDKNNSNSSEDVIQAKRVYTTAVSASEEEIRNSAGNFGPGEHLGEENLEMIKQFKQNPSETSDNTPDELNQHESRNRVEENIQGRGAGEGASGSNGQGNGEPKTKNKKGNAGEKHERREGASGSNGQGDGERKTKDEKSNACEKHERREGGSGSNGQRDFEPEPKDEKGNAREKDERREGASGSNGQGDGEPKPNEEKGNAGGKDGHNTTEGEEISPTASSSGNASGKPTLKQMAADHSLSTGAGSTNATEKEEKLKVKPKDERREGPSGSNGHGDGQPKPKEEKGKTGENGGRYTTQGKEIPPASSSGNASGEQNLKQVQEHPLSTGAGLSDASSTPMGSASGGYYYMKPDTPVDTAGYRGKKNKNEQPRNETTVKKIPSKDSKEQKGVTVVFHAILSAKFKRTESTQIFIVGETPIFHGWRTGSVEIMPVKTLDSHDVLLRGQMTVPMQFVDQRVPYKYCLFTNGTLHYEALIEFETAWGGITNRCLVIPKQFSKRDATWHKYDSFVYHKPGALDFLSYGLQAKDRIAFVREFFPKWSGFHVVTSDCFLTPEKAVEQLNCLLEDVSSVWTFQNTSRKNDISAYYLPLSEVCRDFLIPKINDNLNALSRDVADKKAIVAAVVSSVVIVHVFIDRGIKLDDQLVEKLFKCLRLPPDKSVCDVLVEEMKQFDNGMMSTVTQSLCKFYTLKKSYKSLFKYWIYALPLLHFLRRDSEPFMDIAVVKSIDYSKLKWWGLSSINVKDFWRYISARDVADIVPELSSLFKMDRSLSRSLLLLSPVDMYYDLLCTGDFSLFELCATMRKILREKTDSSYSDEFQIYLETFFSKVNEKLSRLRFLRQIKPSKEQRKPISSCFKTQ